MKYKDYYELLGVERSATQDEIKRAYRKLARTYHPDLNKEAGAEDKFKEIGEANEVLGDPEKRAAYDQLGQNYQPGQDFQPPPNWDDGFEFSGGFDGTDPRARQHSDFFENLFGESYRQQASANQGPRFRAKGQDHHAKITIDLEDAIHGAKRTIAMKVPELTETGHVIVSERKLEVSIPKGIQEGKHIRLKGLGSAGLGGGKPGDLYLEVTFRSHPLYHAEGADLYLDLPITPWEAALGAKIQTPTPGGTVELNVPAGSRQGQKLRLKGRGLPATPPGNLFVVFQIALPPADNDKAKEIYKTMAKELDFNPRSHLLTDIKQEKSSHER